MPTSKKVLPKKTTTPVATSKLAAALNQARTTGMMPTNSGVNRPWLKSTKLTNWLIAVWIVVIAGALYYFRGQFIVATVNGQPIFRSTLIHELERQAGPQTLDNIVLETLVRQEAANKKVTVTDDEVNAELKKIEDQLGQQNQNLDQLLSLQGMTRASLKDQVKLQLLVEKLVGKDGTEVTDDEVKKYIQDNKALLPKDSKPDELMASVRSQLEQQKLSAKTQDWLKALQAKAKVEQWLFKSAPTTGSMTPPTSP